MNAITKNRILIGALVLSVAINLAIVGTMWFYKPKSSPAIPSQSEITKTRANHSRIIASELKLTAEQEGIFKNMRADYAEQTRENRIALKDHYGMVMNELRSSNPNKTLLDSLAHEIGRLHEEQQQATIKHFITLREICSPEQYDHLQQMFSRGMHKGERKLDLEQRHLRQNKQNSRRNRNTTK